MSERGSKPQAPDVSWRDTIILQCLAALLIANSHLEGLYPRAWMAADGLIGNSLFFFLSGYGLVRSEQKNRRSFLDYYWRRIRRIYPVLWLVLVVFPLGLLAAWKTWGIGDYVTNFIYPTGYGYIKLIMVFYLPFFFLARTGRPLLFAGLCGLLTIPYAIRYAFDLPSEGIVYLRLGSTDGWLWAIFYFQMMLMGGFCGSRPDWRPLRSEFQTAGLLVITFCLYVGLKFLMVVTGAYIPGTRWPLGNLYFALVLLTFIIVTLMFQVFTSRPIMSRVAAVAPLKWFVSLVGGLTLEVYLIHEFIAYNPWMKRVPFPVNVPLWLVVTLAVCWLVAKAVGRMTGRAPKTSPRTGKK